jgi:hypothetical protein
MKDELYVELLRPRKIIERPIKKLESTEECRNSRQPPAS